MGLAARQSESEEDLDEAVMRTVECARAPSTRRLYGAKWGVFSSWCRDRGHDPQTCSVAIVLRFLQFLFQRERAHSTLKVYVAAISAGRGAMGVASVGRNPMVAQFLKGARRLRPPRELRAPPWDLRLVLRSLVVAPYEPLDQADLKFLSFKALFLLAMCSARRVGELHALSVEEECMVWKPEGAGVRLWPNPFFLPKVLSTQAINQVIDLDAFAPGQGSEDVGRLLCPVRALRAYTERTLPLRRTSQFFVCFGQTRLGQPASRQRLSNWLVAAIEAAYSGQGFPVPGRLVGHSTRSVATSWAALRGVSLAGICSAATWSSPCTFTRFYRLNVASAAALPGSVLSVGVRR